MVGARADSLNRDTRLGLGRINIRVAGLRRGGL